MKKFRIGKVTYQRGNSVSEWQSKEHESISLAKKANGLNARTAKQFRELPPQQTPQ